MGGAIEVVAACWLCLASVSPLAMGVPGMVAEAVLAAAYAGCAANYRGPDHRRELLGRAGVLAPHRDHRHVDAAQFATHVVRAPDFSPGRPCGHERSLTRVAGMACASVCRRERGLLNFLFIATWQKVVFKHFLLGSLQDKVFMFLSRQLTMVCSHLLH